MIEINGLSYRIDGTKILHDVTMRLESGGITALIGPNGAGKSTLLHCISGLETPERGTVRIDGLDPFAAPARDRARAVALLRQSPALVSRLSVRELVGFGRWPHHQGRPGAADRDAVDRALGAFALADLAGRSIATLSGGQRQRAFIAMTWAQETPWMLLDEPLNALDPRHARDLMARLHALSRDAARSIVIVLHDINAAAGWADRIVAMKAGRIVAQDACAALLTEDTLREVFDTPFELLEHRGRKVVVAR
ncbi:ABC transporter ATP-binding protein [Salipiger aestuarii]|uniref:Iron complex transport system ATP-binding protein n=1 Tax=Salipiger aestuarii TaxID=568098 RepID=A0A327YLX6_9RHOB|nr:ATP-binding cassette domain-containing protein [Salipiger aestuarii]EIE50154.1 ABC transporter-like protein [Citreicella sp. 357]KAA8609937.1 ABC transporter ATP-binding protein [Salipiger aestuarii]KAA8616249.1 ABC transporter ATP-binding protein [Salipiger aestuarii]KAB2543196.1 ABC transporter ATP-binding protein [Salipiger aestuarii]RAK21521.1 iron complex transport system ATP-binding protein [Salipiger aestuarii]